METYFMWIAAAAIVGLLIVVFVQYQDIKNYKSYAKQSEENNHKLLSKIDELQSRSGPDVEGFSKSVAALLSLFNQAGAHIKMRGIEAKIHKDMENEIKFVLGECSLEGKVRGLKDEAKAEGLVDLGLKLLKIFMGGE